MPGSFKARRATAPALILIEAVLSAIPVAPSGVVALSEASIVQDPTFVPANQTLAEEVPLKIEIDKICNPPVATL